MKIKKLTLLFTKFCFTLLIVIVCFSCAQKPKEIIWEKTEDFIVIKINPPKHFYLDLKRVSDGKFFEKVYVSKHCNDMCIEEGSVIKVTYGRYKRGDHVWEEFDNNKIHDLVCNCK